jgi:hypothetical protein
MVRTGAFPPTGFGKTVAANLENLYTAATEGGSAGSAFPSRMSKGLKFEFRGAVSTPSF